MSWTGFGIQQQSYMYIGDETGSHMASIDFPYPFPSQNHALCLAFFPGTEIDDNALIKVRLRNANGDGKHGPQRSRTPEIPTGTTLSPILPSLVVATPAAGFPTRPAFEPPAFTQFEVLVSSCIKGAVAPNALKRVTLLCCCGFLNAFSKWGMTSGLTFGKPRQFVVFPIRLFLCGIRETKI